VAEVVAVEGGGAELVVVTDLRLADEEVVTGVDAIPDRKGSRVGGAASGAGDVLNAPVVNPTTAAAFSSKPPTRSSLSSVRSSAT
jgi:hypothetical protein